MESGLAAERFSAYGTSHGVVLLLLVLVVAGLVWAGRAYRGTTTAERVGKVLAVVTLIFMVPLQVRLLTPGSFDLERTLPLQLCDLAWMTGTYALWTRQRWAVALTYYWGLTLTPQAIITPDLAADFPDLGFILYWGMHLLVVWAAIYLTWGLGLTPDWRSYRTAIVVTAVWALSVFAFNVVADTNYGFLNAKPDAASILDLLGPWPWYVLAEIAIITVVWALVTWPWVALAARGGDRRPWRSASTAGAVPKDR